MNLFEEEIQDFFSLLTKHQVKYILVDGMAANYHGYIRATADIDLWIYDEPLNRKNLSKAFADMGVEGAEIIEKMPLIAGFTEILLNNGVYIDLMSDLQFFSQANFMECYEISDKYTLENNCAVNVLHLNKLIEEKEKGKRPKDLEDAVQLKKIRELRNK